MDGKNNYSRQCNAINSFLSLYHMLFKNPYTYTCKCKEKMFLKPIKLYINLFHFAINDFYQ